MSTDPLRLREAMTLLPSTIERTQTLRSAAALMEQLEIRHLPVVESDGSLLSVLSHREVQTLMHARGIDPDRLRVDEVTHPPPFVASPETALHEVCATMARQHYGCVVAVLGNRPIGIFTSTDACARLSQFLRESQYRESQYREL